MSLPSPPALISTGVRSNLLVDVAIAPAIGLQAAAHVLRTGALWLAVGLLLAGADGSVSRPGQTGPSWWLAALLLIIVANVSFLLRCWANLQTLRLAALSMALLLDIAISMPCLAWLLH